MATNKQKTVRPLAGGKHIKTGQNPKPRFSGKILLRITPEDHALLAKQALSDGKSMNNLLIEAVKIILAR